MANLGVIGWGVVGKATGKGFGRVHNVIWNDPNLRGSTPLKELAKKVDYIFVCVPTPMKADYSGIDLTIMNKVIRDVAKLVSGKNIPVVIKSTVVPGTTDKYAKKFPKVKFAMNPEFLTEINAPWDFMHPDRVVIGAYDEDVANRIAILHRDVLGYEVKIYTTDPKTAEMVKYMSNTFMATKVIFGNEFYELAKKLDINYDDVVKMVGADERILPSFLGVTPYGGFGGKCFPKDTASLLGLARKLKVDLSLLDAAWKKNLKNRKVRDWEEIEGAVKKRGRGRPRKRVKK
jgi:UDPglucose 6-dehydrogenase